VFQPRAKGHAGPDFSKMFVWDAEEKAVALSRISQHAFHKFKCKWGNNTLPKIPLHLKVLFLCLHSACPKTELRVPDLKTEGLIFLILFSTLSPL